MIFTAGEVYAATSGASTVESLGLIGRVLLNSDPNMAVTKGFSLSHGDPVHG